MELVLGNLGEAEDELTLTILDASGQAVAVTTQEVQAVTCDHVVFAMPSGGVEMMPGQVYRMRLTGGSTFGWKYVAGGYENGEATFNGKPLLAQARSTGPSEQDKFSLWTVDANTSNVLASKVRF